MSDLPNVVIVCPALGGTGAVANVALHHAGALAKHFHVSLMSESLPTSLPHGVDARLIRPPAFHWLRRYGHVPREWAFAHWVLRELEAMGRERRLAAVICHGHPVAALAAAPLRRRFGVPYSLVTHGDIFDRPLGTYDPRLTWFYRRVTPSAYRNADLVIALSPHMVSLAIRRGARPERVIMIPNGIDPAEIGLSGIDTPLPGKQLDRLELLYVGRLSVEKGVDVLIEAVALLAARGIAFRLRIIGSGPKGQSLRALTTLLRLNGVVEFLGPVPREQLGIHYCSADVVCVPSRSDPLPTVVLEAMASAKAVVGSDAGGITYLVEHGITGLVFKVEDKTALAEALTRLSGENGLAYRMGMLGKERALNLYNWSIIGERLSQAIICFGQHIKICD